MAVNKNRIKFVCASCGRKLPAGWGGVRCAGNGIPCRKSRNGRLLRPFGRWHPFRDHPVPESFPLFRWEVKGGSVCICLKSIDLLGADWYMVRSFYWEENRESENRHWFFSCVRQYVSSRNRFYIAAERNPIFRLNFGRRDCISTKSSALL